MCNSGSGEEKSSSSGSEDKKKVAKRDRGKAKKYRKLLDAKAIPEHIREQIEEDSKKHENPGAYKSELINLLFEKNDKGGYTLNAQKPIFETYKEAFHKRYGRDERVGIPKSIYLYQTFHGNSEALEDAILKGEVQQWEDEGVLFCGNRKTTAGIEKSSTSGQRLHSGETDLTKNQWNTLSKAFSSMSWDMSALENSGPSSSASGASASQKPKCLEMAGLTSAMEELVADAKGANERLLQSALKMLGKCQNEEDKKNFKATILELKEWITKDENIMQFKDWHVLCCSGCVVNLQSCFFISGFNFPGTSRGRCPHTDQLYLLHVEAGRRDYQIE